MSVDFQEIRKEFPALEQKVNGQSLVYLDSAASALKPKRVIDRLTQFYSFETSNVHRGIHTLSAKATDEFESARKKVQKFINATDEEEVIFTRGTTESINVVAASWGRANITAENNIVLTEMEHHSNLVPWHLLAQEKGCEIRVIPVTDQGELDLAKLDLLIDQNTALVAISQCSNTLGTVNDVKTVIRRAKQLGAKTLVDGAQSVTFQPVDVTELDCDFFVFSGHKIFGPYGIGVLFGKKEVLNKMPPYQGGGAMISEVQLTSSSYLEAPFRFEAGTPHIAGVIGLGAAVDFLMDIGMDQIHSYEKKVGEVVTEQLKSIDDLQLIGDARERAPTFSFVVEGTHANDIGEILDQKGIAVRTGHHCTQPLMRRFSVPATVRASFSIYNNLTDLEKLIEGIRKAMRMLR